MKLKINEMGYLYEDIQAVKKYYPNIPDDVFMQLISLDPTYRNNNSLGKYGKWILNLYNRGTITEDDFSEIKQILAQFTTYKNRIANKDLNAYKSVEELSDALAAVIDDDSMLSDRQKVRFKKNVKAGRVKVAAEDDYDVVFEDDQYIVRVPNTHEASMKLGRDTEWCTAHENPEWYLRYTDNGGQLYIIEDKESGDRWQYSDNTNDFLDEYDEEFEVTDLLDSDEKLKKFMLKVMNIDLTNETYVYKQNSGQIKEIQKPFIKHAVIEDGCTVIGYNAFLDCDNLESVTIPDSVISIRDSAFANCKKLKSIVIPDSVEYIGDYAFAGCGLESIEIPDNVIRIGMNTFLGCKNLTSITIPNTVVAIEGQAFSYCISLETLKLPDSLKEISNGLFSDCSNLKSIIIPDGVERIKGFAFEGCENLLSVTMSNSVKTIGICAFGNCKSLTSITIPNGVEQIKDGAFINCTNLTSITIPDNVIGMGDDVFEGCHNLTVYTNDKEMMGWCSDYNINCEPMSKAKTESLNKKSKKLTIAEDTCCVPAKTSYIEDGFDKNGIYYFGQKPALPKSWRNVQKKKKRKVANEMIKLKESNNMHHEYLFVTSKSVPDSDGFMTDYTMYAEIEAPTDVWYDLLREEMTSIEDIPVEYIKGYVFVFGDNDLYNPNDGMTDFDWEVETEREAWDWFQDYEGFTDEEDW